jgi:hypothetical protein
VSVSADGTQWTEAVAATMPNARAAQFVDLNVQTRYVQPTVTTTWATGTNTKYTNKLLIDQMWLGAEYVSTP